MTAQKATSTEQVDATGNTTAHDTTIIPATPLNLQYSVFENDRSLGIKRLKEPWLRLIRRIETADQYTDKEKCPLVALTTFGEQRITRSDGRAGKLCNGQNQLEIFGVVGDYDGALLNGEKVDIDRAGDMLASYGIEAFLYTSANHKVLSLPKYDGGPRWRVLAPLSGAQPVSERKRLTAMLNYALGGILGPESAEALAFYFGTVQGVEFATRRVSGEPIDLNLVVDELPFQGRQRHPQLADADMPDLVPTDGVPPLGDLRLSPDVLGFLRDGALPEGKASRSHLVAQIAIELLEALPDDDGGLQPALVLSILADNEYTRAFAQDHWNSDPDRYVLYLWRHHVLKGMMKAEPVAAAFDDVTLTAQERDQWADQERAALDAKRREHQKRENERIGEGAYRIPIAEKITLASALERFVFLSEGSQVADVFNPHYVLKLPDWKNTYAASTKEIPGQPGKPPKAAPVTQLWHTSEQRKTATTRTFKAGGGLLLPDPDGKLAVNSWRPFGRASQVADPQAAGVGLFLDHVAFLFGDDAPRFLDWLAHIEQQPGTLPHTSWLHIARHFGMGRNWLASVLARVWAGSVAANLDLVHMFKSSFNDQLSRKVLAVVDEIREGGRDSQWEHSEKLKSTITEEVRRINPKYGHTSMEFNACRWLLFSNHLSAIPLENGDRRIEVVSTEAPPQGPTYYTRLYRALESREFIGAVATMLRKRDISGFNPGAHARNTEAKKAATNASRTPMAEACQLLVDHWPADFITAADLFDVLTGGRADGALTAAHRRTLEQAGIQPFGRAVKIDGKATRVSVVRNTAHWLQQGTADDVRKGLERVEIDAFEVTAYEYLLGLEADA